MGEIAAKLADALSMFWQSLDERERRLFLLGLVWLGVVVVSAPLEARRKQREQAELVEAVAERLRHG